MTSGDISGRLRGLVRRARSAYRPSSRQLTRRPHDTGIIDRYLAKHSVRKLQLGAGPSVLPGWLCTDLRPRRDDVAHLDITKRFPLPEESIDFIAAEHVIEHVAYEAGTAMLEECWRVIRPGGTLRVATPDLRRLVLAYLGEAGAEGEAYRRWTLQRYLGRGPSGHSAFVLNHHVRAWGHTFLFDEETLVASIRAAGFVEVSRRELNSSPRSDLSGIEQHGAQGGKRRRAAVRFETLIVEGSKPAQPSTRPTGRATTTMPHARAELPST